MLPEIWTMPGTGWQLKGYGLMMTVGFLSGVYLAMRRALRVKCDPDMVLNCSLIALIGGVVGSRVFYVVHYWDEQFAQRADLLFALIDITRGGLEFIGGLLTATILIVLYVWKKGCSVRVYVDILAVSTMWSLGVARTGCFLNGCCFGGVCIDPQGHRASALAVEFPFGSPAAVRQWENRQITLPAELIVDGFKPSTTSSLGHSFPLPREVLSMSDEKRDRPRLEYENARRTLEQAKQMGADANEIKALADDVDSSKQRLESHRLGSALGALDLARAYPSREDPARSSTVGELRELAAEYPARWVHPTQLYSSAAAILLSVFLGRVFHRRKRHGVIFGLMLLLYPVMRFIIESIRADNPLDSFGLTVSQAIAVGMFVVGCVYLFVLYRYFPLRSPRAVPYVPDVEPA
ncbi:MAG: hypothetical protein HOP29_09910 [Phycisphaerales bacterium]|nr:hypothetical protein [Phycisphaerales bacterium]